MTSCWSQNEVKEEEAFRMHAEVAECCECAAPPESQHNPHAWQELRSSETATLADRVVQRRVVSKRRYHSVYNKQHNYRYIHVILGTTKQRIQEWRQTCGKWLARWRHHRHVGHPHQVRWVVCVEVGRVGGSSWNHNTWAQQLPTTFPAKLVFL